VDRGDQREHQERATSGHGHGDPPLDRVAAIERNGPCIIVCQLTQVEAVVSIPRRRALAYNPGVDSPHDSRPVPPDPSRVPTTPVDPPPRRGCWRDRRPLAALAIAVAADAVQIALLPLFIEGAAAPWNDALDLAVGAALLALLGWHVAFLPAFLSELVPFLDLFPTWTAAVVFVVTRPSVSNGPPLTGRASRQAAERRRQAH